MGILLFVLVSAGLGGLALGMERHAKPVFGKAAVPRFRRLCCGLGWVGLGAALVSAVHFYGASGGIVIFFGMITLVLPGIALILAYYPRL